MPTRISLQRSLAVSAASLTLAALLTTPAHAGGPLAYQYTDIPNAALGATGSQASSRAVGITNTGIVAGVYDTTSGSAASVNYHPEGGGPEFDAISSSGNLALGDYATASGGIHYFTYSNGLAADLPDPAGIPFNDLNPGPNYSYYTGINNSGALTGYFSADGGATTQSLLFENGVQTTFTDPLDDLGYTGAYGINASGTIVGTYASSVTRSTGFFRAADGTFTLYSVPGARNTYLFGESDNGNFFGDFNLVKGGAYEGFAVVNGQLIEGIEFPGTSGQDGTFPATAITGINDAGQISGVYTAADGSHHSFYAAPAPAPEAGTTFGLGLGLSVLAVLAYRRRAGKRA